MYVLYVLYVCNAFWCTAHVLCGSIHTYVHYGVCAYMFLYVCMYVRVYTASVQRGIYHVIQSVLLPSPLTVTQDASVGVWSPSFQFQQGFVACEEDACSTSGLYSTGGNSGHRSKVMVTDCVLMENCSKLVLALTKRELQFHDIPLGSSTGQTMKIKVFGESTTTV